jgi:hypothetical protein
MHELECFRDVVPKLAHRAGISLEVSPFQIEVFASERASSWLLEQPSLRSTALDRRVLKEIRPNLPDLLGRRTLGMFGDVSHAPEFCQDLPILPVAWPDTNPSTKRVARCIDIKTARSEGCQDVTERSNAATEERFKSGQAVGVVSIV